MSRLATATPTTTRLTLRELPPTAHVTAGTCLVELSIVQRSETISFRFPFGDDQEQELSWFLEFYPQSPFSAGRADKVARSLDQYSKDILLQILACSLLESSIATGASNTALEVLIEPLTSTASLSRFNQVHWEILEDATLWTDIDLPFAKVQVVRKVKCSSIPESKSSTIAPHPDDKIRILFVCARRSLDSNIDISSRLIMQPVFEIIDEAKIQGRVGETQILRNATWKELESTLRSKPKGWFDEVHFDCHGEVIGGKAYLIFASRTSPGTEKVLASSIAGVLIEAGTSLANLNACSTALASAKTVDENLAITFAKAGIPITIAMSYDILDAASCRFEEEFYRSWLLRADQNFTTKRTILDKFRRKPAVQSLKDSACHAVRDGRAALKARDERAGHGGWQVRLRDDIVPVIYVSDVVKAPVTTFAEPSVHQSETHDSKWSAGLRAALPPFSSSRFSARSTGTGSPLSPRKNEPTSASKDKSFYSSLSPSGFRFKQFDPPIVGRDSAVVQLEQMMSSPDQNVCFVQGRGGSGKSLFSRHVCDWWKTSSFVQDFFYIDLHKIAMIQSAQHEHNHELCTNYAEDDLIDEAFVSMFDVLWPGTRRGHKGQMYLTESQWGTLVREIRSRKYLIVFDNADFPLCEKGDVIGSTKVMTIGSGIPCRDSLKSSLSCLMTLGAFLGAVEDGQSKMIITTRYKKWIIDGYCASKRSYFALPQLPVSAALVVAQRSIDALEADKRKHEYPGVKEDISSIVEMLQFNPLAIEAVMAHMVRNNLSPKESHLRLCTEGFVLDELDASLAYAGGGRFISELQTMCSLDWNNGADETRRPFSMFWISSFLGYLPEMEHYSFWFLVVGFLLSSWGGSLAQLGLETDRSESEVRSLLARKITHQSQYVEAVEALGLSDEVATLIDLMEEVGVVEPEETTDGDSGEVKMLCKVHPLFTLIGRDGTWGYDDEDYLEKTCHWRRAAAGQYLLTKYQVLYTEQILGGSAGLEIYKSGSIPLQTAETRSGTLKFLHSALQDLPTLIGALLWATNIPAEGSHINWWIGAPDYLRATIFVALALAETKKETLYIISEAIHQLYEKCQSVFQQSSSLASSSKFVGIIARLAFVLANMSSGRDGLPAPFVYLEQERDLLERHRARVEVSEGPLQSLFPVDLEILLQQVNTSEANFYALAGDHEKAFQLQRKILSSRPPSRVPERIHRVYLTPVIVQWLTQLKVRNEAFPTVHELFQSKKPIRDIIDEAKLWDVSGATAFTQDVQSLLQQSVHKLVSTDSLLPVPPPNRRFDSRFLDLLGSSAGESVVNGMGTVHPSLTISPDTETTLLKKFLLLSDVTGSSGLASVHMRAASLLIGSGQWIEGLRHLKSYNSLPMPQEDRMRPELRCQNSLLAVLCLSKLRCFELARTHAFQALKEAMQAHDDGQALILSLGALAGLQAGRTRAPTLYAKLLLLLASRTAYFPQQPHHSSSDGTSPSAFQLNCRNGYRLRLMTMLGSLTPKNGDSHNPNLFSRMVKYRKRERIERNELSVEHLEDFEACFDTTVMIVQMDIARIVKKHRAGRPFWVGRTLEDELYAEAEMCLFGIEPVDRKKLVHLGKSSWVKDYKTFRAHVFCLLLIALVKVPDRKYNSAPELNPDLNHNPPQLNLDSLRNKLSIPSTPLSFNPPQSALSAYRARKAQREDDSDSDSEPDLDTDDVDQDGYSRHKMFWDHATDHLMAKELVRGVYTRDAWVEVEREMGVMRRQLGDR